MGGARGRTGPRPIRAIIRRITLARAVVILIFDYMYSSTDAGRVAGCDVRPLVSLHVARRRRALRQPMLNEFLFESRNLVGRERGLDGRADGRN